VLGIGLGCYRVADNLYIKIVIENGIIGLTLFMFLIYRTIKKFYYLDDKKQIRHCAKIT
jgi:O-antigen ligase